MIMSSIIDQNPYLQALLKEFLEVFKFIADNRKKCTLNHPFYLHFGH